MGPLLFILYVNNFRNCLDFSTNISFADDTNIFITGKNIQSVYLKTNLELKNIDEWMTANKLIVNSAKTKYLFLLLEKVIIPSQIHGLKYILEIILLKKFYQFAF